jgi:hypothetical protein
MPNGNSAGSGLPSGSGGNLPQGGTGGGEGPLVSNPPVPIVDDEKILALQDDPTIQNLLPPPPAFNGDPLPANTPLLDSEEDRSILAAAAVPVPCTGWLMVLACPLLLFFRGAPASRRR